ncbi:MAG: FAD-dependent thymidylate synthase, partial [Planctomycetota bacterium]|nr:FAD-dependent thymidylate synthase [Planctomycetota bacterium]
MHGDARWEIPVHDHGFVALVDAMPRLVPQGQTADSAIVQAARVSYGAGTKKVNEDRGLIRYLLRHRHTTPLEM